VVTVGVTDFVIVDTPDALLIVHEEKAQEVREALEEIERRGKTEYL
jgi:mannose-1-phosphate guanylyltransferase